ncbi:MAG: AAA family ATPase, partial [Pseudomonadota bacterium]
MTAHRVSQTNADARGIVRLSPDDLQAANLNPGDTVSLDAARRVYARAAPGHIKVGEVALDATTAQNAGVSIGDDVAVARAPLGLIEALHLRLPQRVAATPADLQEALFDMALTDGDEVGIALPGYGQSRAHVARVEPNGAGLVGDATAIVIETPPEAASDQTPAYAGIAGMRSQIERVHEIVSTPLLRPDLFAHLGLSAPKGLLFTGPPGSGKTLLARAVAKRTKAAFFQIDGAEILSKHYGESEAALRRVFEAASTAQPAIIFIDEIDALAPRRADLSGEKQVERRVVAQLLTLLDGLGDRGRVVVMAATNLPDAIDAALRRPGRFDREIAFTPPSETERAEILALHLAEAPLAADTDLAAIARQAVGYVGADLAALAREAGMAALARSVRAAGGETKLATQDVALTQADLEAGLAKSAPAALRSHASAARPVTWDDIGGLEAAKTNLLQAVEWPRKHPKSLAALGLSAPRGILLTGPPGGGKTLLARALAGAEAMNFIPVRPPDLLSQFLGQAERGLAQLFETARLTAPSLLFFDEI